MKPSKRPTLCASVFALLLCGCTPSPVKPLHEALDGYFDGGYVPYALPGQGAIFEPGTIIRYQKKAEVLVRTRSECFDLPTFGSNVTAPKTEWSEKTELDAALSMLLPKAAALDLEASLKKTGTESLAVSFGTLESKQIPVGSVQDWRIHPGFPEKCKSEFGKGNILVLGVIGSTQVRYQLKSADDVSTALKAATSLNLGGNAKVSRSGAGSNVLEVVSAAPTVIGYIPYEMKLEGEAGRGETGTPVLRQLSLDEARRLRSQSGN